MLIICCGMPRSGSTWQYQIVSELLEQSGVGRRIGFLPGESFMNSSYVDLMSKETFILKCHDYHPYYEQLCKSGLAKAIYSFRDIREVVLSIAWKLGITTMETIRSDALKHAIVAYYQWTALPNILIQRYEDFTSQPEKAVGEITAYVGLSVSESDAVQLAQKFSKAANRNYVDKFKAALLAQGVEPEKDYLKYDQHSLLHWNHIRPEMAAKWQDLSFEELQELSAVVQCWLMDAGFEKNDNWIRNSKI